jgi:hypothetical protein
MTSGRLFSFWGRGRQSNRIDRYGDPTCVARTLHLFIPVRLLSSSDKEEAHDSAASSKAQERGSNKDNKVQFPWRHSQTLLPRINYENYRFNKDWKSKLFIGFWERSTGFLMEKPLSELVGRQWRQDLAEDSAWAFSFGTAALLSNTFKGTWEGWVV